MNLEKLASLIRQLQGAMDGRSMKVGTGTATWTAAVSSANVVVNHGLSAAPTVVVTGTRDDLFGYAVTARTATTFTVKGFTTHNAAVSTSRTFDWIAIL